MKFIATSAAVVAAYALPASTVAAGGAEGAAWGYKNNDTAMASPAQWGEHYPHCDGTIQSPIDIVSSDGKQSTKAKSTLRFRGDCPSFNLTQTEEGFKASVVKGA